MTQPAGQAPPQDLNLRILLQEMIQRGASDLHLTVGNPVKIRIDGDLTDSLIKQVLAPKDTLSLGVFDPDGKPEETLRDGGRAGLLVRGSEPLPLSW